MAASNAIRATVAGWTTPLQWTVTSGGNTVDWYSPRLAAGTLSGPLFAYVWVSESNAAANVTVRLQVDVVNNTGTVVSTYGAATSNTGAPVTTAGRVLVSVAGPDTAIAAGNRLRFRFFIDDFEAAMGSGHTATISYNVATPGASGDSYIYIPAQLVEFVLTLTPTGVASTNAFGLPNVATSGPQTLTSTAGVSNTSAFGSASLDLNLTASGVANTGAFGEPTVRLQQIRFLAASAVATGSTTATVAYPTGIEAFDLLVYVVAYKPSAGIAGVDVGAPSGKLGFISGNTLGGGYGGATGIDTGDIYLDVLYCIPDSPITGNVTFTGSSTNVFWAQVLHYRGQTSSYYWIDATANDTTGDSTFTGTAVSSGSRLVPPEFGADIPGYNLPAKAGDQLLLLGAIPTDVGAGAQFSGYSLSAPGITIATPIEVSEPFSATGQDIGGFVARSQIATGTATTSPVGNWTISATASGTTTNVRGPLTVIVLRNTEPLLLTGVASTTAFGSHSVSFNQDLTATGVASTSAFGSSSATRTDLRLIATSSIPFTGSGPHSLPIPPEVQVGDYVVIHFGYKPLTTTDSSPSTNGIVFTSGAGITEFFSGGGSAYSGGYAAQGDDVGLMRATMRYTRVNALPTGDLQFRCNDADNGFAYLVVLRNIRGNSIYNHRTEISYNQNTAPGSTLTATFTLAGGTKAGSSPFPSYGLNRNTRAGSWAFGFMAIPTDAASGNQFSNPRVTSGLANHFAPGVELSEPYNVSGWQSGGVVFYAVSTQAATGTTSMSALLDVASPTTNVRGPVFLSIFEPDTVVVPEGLENANAFGSPEVTALQPALDLNPSSVVNTSEFGSASLKLNLTSSSVDDSTDLFGSPSLKFGLSASGVSNESAYGTAQVTTGPVSLQATSVENTSLFGSATVAPQPVTLTANSFSNTSVIGSPHYIATETVYTVASSGTTYTSNTTFQIPFPPDLQAGQLTLLLLAGKMSHPMEEPGYPNFLQVTSGREYMLINSELFLGNYVAQTADQGNSGFYIYARIADGTEPAFETVSLSGMLSSASSILSVKGITGNGYKIWSAGAEKGSPGTQVSLSFDGDNGFKTVSHLIGFDESHGDEIVTYGPDRPVIQAGDLLVAAFVTPTDITDGAFFTNVRFTSPDLVTGGTNKLTELDADLEYDLGGFLAESHVVYGSSVDGVTLEATADSDSDVRGAAFLIVIRSETILGASSVVDSTDAYGTPTVTPGPVTLSASAVDDSTDTFGVPVFTAGEAALVVSGFDDSVDGFGQATITTGPITITASSVDDSADGIGQKTVIPREVTLLAQGVNDRTDLFGAPSITVGAVTLPVSSVDDSLDALGTHAVTVGAVTLSASSVIDGRYYTPEGNLADFELEPYVPPAGDQLVFVIGDQFGQATILPQPVTATASAVTNTSEFGTAVITAGAVTLSASSVVNTSTFGEPALALLLSAAGATNTSEIGSPAIQVGAVTLSTSAVVNTSAVGTHAISVGAVTLATTAVTNVTAFGPAILERGEVSLTASSVQNVSEFGAPYVLGSGVGILVQSVVNVSTFGSPTAVPGAVTISSAAVENTSAFGLAAIVTGAVLLQSSAVDDRIDQFGSPTVNNALALAASSVTNVSLVGAPTVTAGAVTITAAGAENASIAGGARLRLNLQAAGAQNTSQVGSPAVVAGAAQVRPSSVQNLSSFGSPAVQPGPVTISAAGAQNTSVAGTPKVGLQVRASGSANESQVGSPSVTTGPVILQATGVTNTPRFGAGTALPGPVTLQGSSTPSSTAVGSPTVQPGVFRVRQSSVVLAPAFGVPAVFPGPVTVAAAGVQDLELFGAPFVLRFGTAAPERTVTVASENRTVTVAGEDRSVTAILESSPPRTVVVAEERRLVTVEAQDRSVIVPAESRVVVLS